jgi:hypothetical protein
MGNLIPGAAMIYERVGTTVYARYRDSPHNRLSRWAIGEAAPSDPEVSPSYRDWLEITRIAKENVTLQKQLDKLFLTYYTIRDH